MRIVVRTCEGRLAPAQVICISHEQNNLASEVGSRPWPTALQRARIHERAQITLVTYEQASDH